MSTVQFDIKEFEESLKKFESFYKDFKEDFLINFLKTQALIALSSTKALTPVDSGDLRNRWEISDVKRITNGYEIMLFNTLEYASYIEDGHNQKVGRFVPGVFVNGVFRYKKGAKSGIVLKKPFINGFHMCRISLERLDNDMKTQFDQAVKVFLARYKI